MPAGPRVQRPFHKCTAVNFCTWTFLEPKHSAVSPGVTLAYRPKSAQSGSSIHSFAGGDLLFSQLEIRLLEENSSLYIFSHR